MREIIFVESVASGHGPLSLTIAHQCGLSVAFFTKDPAFYQVWGSSNPLAEVDRLVVTNTSDASEMRRHVRRNASVGVIALDDFHVIPASELAGAFSLPRASVQGLKNARHKDATRRLLEDIGDVRPRFVVFEGEDELQRSPVGYPCVLKPSDGTGSVGVYVCNDEADMRRAVRAMRARWQVIRDHQLSRRWMLEEYIDGPEYSAELIWHHGRWELLGITQKILSPPPFCVEVGHVFPATLEPQQWALVLQKCRRWLGAIGLDFGAAHIEFRISAGTPVVMEINPRQGGGMIPELIRLATGFDVLRHLFMTYTATPGAQWNGDVTFAQAAAIRFLLAGSPGVVEEIHGRDSALACPGVTRCVLPRTPLQVAATESSYDRLGYVIATGKSGQEADRNAQEALSRLAVRYQ